MKKSILAGLLLVLSAFTSTITMAAEKTIYSFSVVPQYPAAQLHREWIPVIDRIKNETGINLELKIAASIPGFETEFINGTPDFAYMNPYHAVMAKKAQGYVPLVRDSKQLTGILLVRRDSPYKSVQDLNGKVIGFPAPNAFGASLYMRALLTESFRIKFEPRYLKTHSNVFRQVVRGEVAACGSIETTLRDDLPEIQEQLHVLYQTPGVASHPIAAHPRVPNQVKMAVMEAILALQSDDAGRNILNEIRIKRPVKASYDQDYLPLEKLNVEKFVVLDKKE